MAAVAAPMLALSILVITAAAGCKREPPEDPRAAARREATHREILTALDEIFRAGDEATSTVTIQLPTGETAQARRPHLHSIAPGRTPATPSRRDPLTPIAAAADVAPHPPEAFDWAPRDSTILLAADANGLWRIEARTGRASPWIPLPGDCRPRQVLSSPRGGVLLAEPGKAIVVDWPDAKHPVTAPPQFRFNYAFWHPDGRHVVGVLEYLNFSAEDEQIHLTAQLWNPETGELRKLDTPPLGALAWLGATNAHAFVSASPSGSAPPPSSSRETEPRGRWWALPRFPAMIDPFPAALLAWKDTEPRGWTPAAIAPAWTDTEPDEAADPDGNATCVWLQRGRKGTREGIVWMRRTPPTAQSPSRQSWTDGARPLSELPVRRVALSDDGLSIAFSIHDAATTTANAQRTRTLFAADAHAAYGDAAKADVAGAVARRLECRRLFLDHLDAAWAEDAQPPATPPTAADPSRIARRIRELDTAFADAARRHLGIEPDHSLASLAEIEAQLDWIGGDLDARPGFIAALGAYYGETLARCGSAAWTLDRWPPDLLAPEPDLAVSDEFLYTLHAPFSSAWHAAARRLSLAHAAHSLLTEWTRPVYLVERFDRATLLALARRDAPPWNLLAQLTPPITPSPDSPVPTFTHSNIQTFSPSPSPPSPDSTDSTFSLSHLHTFSPSSSPSPDSPVPTFTHSNIQTFSPSSSPSPSPSLLPAEPWQIAILLAKMHPESPRACTLLAETLAEAHWTGPALAAWLRAAEMDPANPEYALRAGRAAVDDQRYDLAAQLFLRARALDTHGECKAQLDEYLSALDIP